MGIQYKAEVLYLQMIINEIIDTSIKGRKYPSFQIHHIVAKKADVAKPARRLLKLYNIGINSEYNLVTICNTLHRHLHRNAYYVAVNLIVCQSAAIGRLSYDNIRHRIIASLMYISMILLFASSAVI